jgi:hypothetical protein
VLISILGAYQLPIGTFSTRDACAAAAREAVHIEASGQVVSNQPTVWGRARDGEVIPGPEDRQP